MQFLMHLLIAIGIACRFPGDMDCMPCLVDLVVLSLRRRLACRTTDSLTPTGGEEILFFQTMHIFLP